MAAAAAVIGAGLVPATIAATSGGVLPLAHITPTGPAELGYDDALLASGMGANGMRGLNDQISDEVLRDAGDPAKLAIGAGPLADLPSGPLGIPGIALQAYQHAASLLAARQPGCHLPWTLLAGIGRIESDHGHGQFDVHGTSVTPILGPELNGAGGTALVADTDRGRMDADLRFDRAVGPMQFIPATWRKYAADGNGDGAANVNNIFDASLATGRYLCAAGGNLADPARRAAAVFAYNPSDSYVRTVLIWADAYAHGVLPVVVAPVAAPPGPAAPGAPPPAGAQTPLPGAPPGTPGGPPPASTPGRPGSTPPSSSAPGSSAPGSPSTSPTPTCPPLTPTPTPTPSTSPTPPTTTVTYPPGCPTPTPTPTPTPKPSSSSASSPGSSSASSSKSAVTPTPSSRTPSAGSR